MEDSCKYFILAINTENSLKMFYKISILSITLKKYPPLFRFSNIIQPLDVICKKKCGVFPLAYQRTSVNNYSIVMAKVIYKKRMQFFSLFPHDNLEIGHVLLPLCRVQLG